MGCIVEPVAVLVGSLRGGGEAPACPDFLSSGFPENEEKEMSSGGRFRLDLLMASMIYGLGRRFLGIYFR